MRYQIAHWAQPANGRAVLYPAELRCLDGRVFFFAGGYGDNNRFPTQEGCDLIVRWMEQRKMQRVSSTLIEVFDLARAAYEV